jgi:Cu-Zn family superoxide dismutase
MKTLALAALIPVALCAGPALQDSFAGEAPARAGGGNPPATAAVTPRSTAKASLVSAPGRSVQGDLTLSNEGTAVTIRGEITGLDPGKEHGFHVHENGQCSAPDFTSAGGHFNPTNAEHGGPKSDEKHLGDIPNVKADKDGRATVDVSVKGATLVDKDGSPNEILGKALVVHAMPDDYKTQPSGDSGARIACGVIK